MPHMNFTTITSVSKSLFFFILFIGGILWSSLFAFSRVSTNVVKTPYGVLEQNGVSMVFHQGDVLNPYIKISPFDDYVYLPNGKKEHVFNEKEEQSVKTSMSFWEKVQFHFSTMFHTSSSLSWHVSSEKREIIYTASLSEKELGIKRQIIKDSTKVVGYGNALVLCHGCVVTDTDRIFFSGVYATNMKLSLAVNNSLTPILVGEQLPETERLFIRKDGKKLFQLDSSGEVSYQEPWRLLEIKSKSPDQKVEIYL